MKLIIIFTILLEMIQIIVCAINEANAFSFLKKYGHLKFHSRKSLNFSKEFILEKGILSFQTSARLNKTGHLDNQTLKVMNLPRCGVTDSSKKRKMLKFVINGSVWKAKTIYYNILNYPSSLTKEQVDGEIAKAFSIWSPYTNIKFVPRKWKAQINIGFVIEEHGDGAPFNATELHYAHGSFPVCKLINSLISAQNYFQRYGGYIHFNNYKFWEIQNETLIPYNVSRVDLFQVAVHEIGHALGLHHSENELAIMTEYFSYRPNFTLHSDDIAGIEHLYKKDDLNLCKHSKIDTIFYKTDEEIYVFQGHWYWKLIKKGNHSTIESKPQKISSKWPDLPGNIDAAFNLFDNLTYFFKNNLYWIYRDEELLPNFPKLIASDFAHIPNNLDTIIFEKSNNVLLFFKDTHYWEYYIDKGYISDAMSMYDRRMPTNLDASLPTKWENVHYFFKDNSYYLINISLQYVFDDNTPEYKYQKSIVRDWFGCEHNPLVYIETDE